jgi:hypothetical protein
MDRRRFFQNLAFTTAAQALPAAAEQLPNSPPAPTDISGYTLVREFPHEGVGW